MAGRKDRFGGTPKPTRETRALPSKILLALGAFRGTIPSMTKRAISAVAGFLGCCLSLSAQPTQSLDPLQFDGITPPALTLTDRDFFTFSTAFGWVPPTSGFLPMFNPWDPRSIDYPYTPARMNSRERVVEMRSPDRVYFGGEVGFLYGRSDRQIRSRGFSEPTLPGRWGMSTSPSQPVISVRSRADAFRTGAARVVAPRLVGRDSVEPRRYVTFPDGSTESRPTSRLWA